MAVPSVVAMAATRAGRRTSLTSGLDRGVVHVPWRSANEASHVHVKDIKVFLCVKLWSEKGTKTWASPLSHSVPREL